MTFMPSKMPYRIYSLTTFMPLKMPHRIYWLTTFMPSKMPHRMYSLTTLMARRTSTTRIDGRTIFMPFFIMRPAPM